MGFYLKTKLLVKSNLFGPNCNFRFFGFLLLHVSILDLRSDFELNNSKFVNCITFSFADTSMHLDPH